MNTQAATSGNAPVPPATVGNAPTSSAPPGSNPNKTNARKRQGFRPRTQNKSRTDSSSDRIKWVDPLPTPSGIRVTDFSETPIQESVASFELDPKFLESMVESVNSAIEALAYRSQVEEAQLPLMSELLRSMTDLKLVKRLYSTAKSSEKSSLLKLKGIYYNTSKIPTPLVQAAEIIGHFKSKLGNLEIRHLEQTMLVLAANATRRISDESCPQLFDQLTPVDDPSNMIWDSPGSIMYAHDLIQEQIEERVNKHRFVVRIEDNDIDMSTPGQDQLEIEDYLNILNNYNDPDAYVRKRLLVLSTNSYQDLIANNSILLTDVGLRPANATITQLGINGTLIAAEYARKVEFRMEAYFTTDDVSTSEEGTAAQLAQNLGHMDAKSPFPLSGADQALGYILTPSSNFRYYGEWREGSVTNRINMQNEFVSHTAKR